MAFYHVTLMKLINLEVEAKDINDARKEAIREHSYGDYEQSWENSSVMIHNIEKFSDEDDV